MTVSSSTNKVSFSGNGTLTTFAYSFKIFDQDDLTVILRAADGTETTQTITTHYTVTGVGSASGGNVVFGTAPASGVTVVIIREQPLTQGLDLVPNDPFPAQSLEESLDKLTFMAQKHEEELSRAIKGSRTNVITNSEFTVSATDRANKLFSFDAAGNLSIAQELGTFRGNWAASTAYNPRDIVKDTSTNNIFLVNTAHTSSGSQPLTTNANSAKYDLIVDAASSTTAQTAAASSATAAASSATASANSATAAASSATASETAKTASETAKTDSETAQAASEAALDSFDDRYLGAKSTSGGNPTVDNDGDALIDGALFFDTTNNVLMVYNLGTTTWLRTTPTTTDQGHINTVSGISANVTTVAGISSNVTTVAGISSDVTTVAADGTDIGTVAGISSNVTTVAGISGNVTTVAGISSDVTAVAGDATDIGTVATNISNVNAVGGISANVTTVAGIASNVTTVAGISANVTTVAGDTTNIGTIATNLSGTDTIGTVAGSIGNVNNVGGAITNVNTVATNISGVNSFAERYRVGSSDPTSSLDEGDLFFNTTSNAYKFYDGSAWNTVNVSGIGSLADDTSPQLGGNLDVNSNDINFGDNDKAIFGAGSDLQIFHDGSGSYVKEGGTGSLYLQGTDVRIQNASGENILNGTSNGAVTLYYDNESQLATTSTGIAVDSGSSGMIDFGDITSAYGRLYADSSGTYVGSKSSHPLIFRTANVEKVRVDTSGNLLVGKSTTGFNSYGVRLSDDTNQFVVNNAAVVQFNRRNGDGEILGLYADDGRIGGIGVKSSKPYLVNPTNFGIRLANNALVATDESGTNESGASDLGASDVKWKDLYLSGGVVDTTTTVSYASSIALSYDNGAIQTVTLTGDVTFTDSLADGEAVVLMLLAGASHNVAWTAVNYWVSSGGNAAPTLTAKDTIVLWKIGSDVYAAYAGSFA
jgi:hypothetical protein